MAEVYLALMSGPSGFNKLLVLKILRDDLDTNREDLTAMFLNEARLAARLHHPCIVQTYEFGELDGRPFIAMEYLEGQPLRAIQRKFSPSGLPLAEELRVLSETARGLHYAHELAGFDGEQLSVVHRDISPQNVFVTYDGQAKLLDFGIAKTDSAEHLTKVGAIKGKIDYMAPEQVRGDKVDRRADVFALGAMLWEAVTGERFGGGPKLAEVTKIHRRLTAAEPSVRELRPDVPEALACLIEESLALSPAERLPNAALFADRIEAYLSRLPARPSDRSLAELLASRYREDQVERRKLIDKQVKVIQDKSKMLESLRSSIRPLDFGMTSTGMIDLGTASRSIISSVSDSQAGVVAAVAAAAQQPPHAKHKATWLAGAALVLAGALTMALVLRGSQPPATAAAPTAPVTPAVVAPVAAAPVVTSLAANTVKITIDVTPANARVTLDGVPVNKIPFTGSFQAGDAIHYLQVSAEGYQTLKQMVTFEEDRSISIALVPVVARERPKVAARPSNSHGGGAQRAVEVAEPAPKPAAPVAPAAEPASSDFVELKNSGKSRRFDRTDPYAN